MTSSLRPIADVIYLAYQTLLAQGGAECEHCLRVGRVLKGCHKMIEQEINKQGVKDGTEAIT
jgi:hypothetical protein